jgi:hypothetical protein
MSNQKGMNDGKESGDYRQAYNGLCCLAPCTGDRICNVVNHEDREVQQGPQDPPDLSCPEPAVDQGRLAEDP